jgi:four helix bundle protein
MSDEQPVMSVAQRREQSTGEADGQTPTIQERSFAFAVRILRLVRAVPNDTAGQAVSRQLARCGTSVGANIEEAQASHSKREFIRRINIARSEARETVYWLRLLAEADLLRQDLLQPLTQEGKAIVRILTSIVLTAKERTRPST